MAWSEWTDTTTKDHPLDLRDVRFRDSLKEIYLYTVNSWFVEHSATRCGHGCQLGKLKPSRRVDKLMFDWTINGY